MIKRGGPGGPRAVGTGVKLDPKTFRRLLGYVFKGYKMRFFAVFVCIIINALAGVAGSLFLKELINDHIGGMIAAKEAGITPDVMPLIWALVKMGCIYLVGMICAFLQNRIMVTISQGVQKSIRDEMFEKMQRLPISYFDRNTHGDIMSRYTNDIDTLRQMLSQSIPQAFSSTITIISVFISMCIVSLPLTGFVIVSLVVMMMITGKIAGKSGKYFVAQQSSIAEVNGYIEEMINGQKVVKVFNHEQPSKEAFDELNDELYTNAREANGFANILGPINNNLGHLQYTLIAVLGGVLAIYNVGGLKIGGIASFLQLSRSFMMPINQIVQQVNFIIMALAGAKRIFALIDEKPETDEGYVT
ncbi:MAG: ABC transporter ATP-binding protein, partial [Ruminiclostridium sp.]|nr:ABC transporter ATP-binding protein [Ruminiclostridium sp.]